MRALLGRGTGGRLILVAVVAAILAACSGSAALPGAGGTGFPGGGGGVDTGVEPMPSAAPSQGPAEAPGGTGSDSGPLADNLQVVYTGSLQLVVANMAEATAKADAAVTAAGGYIGASQEVNKDDQPVAVITYRIPASKWDDTVATLRGLAVKVESGQTQTVEVGGQVVDLRARITNLRASEAALQEIALKTAKVSDLLEVQAQLTDVRGQIEQLDAQLQLLQNQVAYGTLAVTFGLEVQQVKEAAKGWNPGADVDAAAAALISATQQLTSAAIWFVIVWLPFLLLTLIGLSIVWRLLRRFGPKPSVAVEPAPDWTVGGPPPKA